MPEAPEKVTLKLIAEKSGTSIGTVDRALMGRNGISEKTKQRVLDVARELGYRPNRFASALSRKKILRLGIAYPENPRGFYGFIDQGVDRAAEELADYGVTIEKLRYPAQTPSDQAEMMKALEPDHFDALAVNAAGPATSIEINRMTRAGVPVITFNSDAPDSDRLFFVGNDSLQSGRMGAELLGRMLGGEGAVTVMGNFAQVTPFAERFGGFCDVIQNEYPGIRLYPCADCFSDSAIASRSLISVLAQVADMKGVFCTGYSSTVGAITALKALNRKDIVLIGYDVSEEIIGALLDGWCDVQLFQDPYRQGYEAARLLARHLLEGWTPDQARLHIETHIVLKHNAESYKSGLVRWDRFT